MPLFVLQSSVYASRFRRVSALISIVGLPLLLAGCLVGLEKPNAALDVPDTYANRVRSPDAALPTADWWRGFRSKQLTDLVEESLTSNLDVAAAIARIVQADAQARVAGAVAADGR
jgi:outer membrane protein TolC